MFAFIYWLCAIICLVYFVLQWDKSRNKLKVIGGMLLSFAPFFNVLLTIIVLKRSWPTITKLWMKLVTL